MNYWEEIAVNLLNKSLNTVPQELNELDWKCALSTKTERLAQHISAFANYPGGGFLVIGIDNEGQSSPLSKSEMDEIVQKLGNIARNNLVQPVRIEHSVISYNNQPVLFIHIPEQSNKPVHLRGSNIFDCYTRSAGQTVKLSRHEATQLIAFSSGYDFEAQTAMSNVDNDEIIRQIDYDSYFTLQEKRLPETKNNIILALADDNLVRKTNTDWDILKLGAILFAKNLNTFKHLSRKAVRVIVYEGISRIKAFKEQESSKGYASGFSGLISYIMDQLNTNEIIETALRKNAKVYPEIAVREFVANAVIHQDFMVSGTGVMIEIFADRIEITNPDVPLVDINRFIDTAPKSRNESLASLMRRLNICEERGSGIDRAIDAIEFFQLPAPKFIRGDDNTCVILYDSATLTQMNNEDRIRACYQHTCLHYVNNQNVNNQSVRKRFNIGINNVSFASKIIADTIESGLIKPSDPDNGSKKFASYIPFWA